MDQQNVSVIVLELIGVLNKHKPSKVEMASIMYLFNLSIQHSLTEGYDEYKKELLDKLKAEKN